VLAADHRLRDSNAFRRTVSSGRRAGGAALVVHLLDDAPGPGSSGQHDGPRVGLVVGKAVGNAVVRNRVKRQLRHLVRGHLTDLPTSSALVIRALPPAAGLGSTELGADLTRCLQRVGQADLPRDPASATRTGSVMRTKS
jgi:ribonuclease P protein component